MKSASQLPFRVDFYELLDAPESADPQELKLAYRRQAKKYHPDHNPGSPAAEERFKLILEAYRVLGDEEMREQYDAWLARQRLYVRAPELQGLGGRVRVSARHAHERREQREARRRGRGSAGTFRRARATSKGLFADIRMPRLGMYVRLAFYAMALFIIVPIMLRGLSVVANRHREPRQVSHRQGHTDLPPEVVQARLMQRNAELLLRAERGDAAAQFQYGWNLYHGYYGMSVNRAEARGWFEKAAAAGHSQARQVLAKADFSEPTAEDSLPPVASPSNEEGVRGAGADEAAPEGGGSRGVEGRPGISFD